MRCLLWTMLALPAHAAGIRGSESALSNLESAAKDPDYTSEPDIGSRFISAHWDLDISAHGGSEGAPCCFPHGAPWTDGPLNGVPMQCSPQGFGRASKQLSQQACNEKGGYSTYCPTCHCLHDPNFNCGCRLGNVLNVHFECRVPGSNPNLVGGPSVCRCIPG